MRKKTVVRSILKFEDFRYTQSGLMANKRNKQLHIDAATEDSVKILRKCNLELEFDVILGDKIERLLSVDSLRIVNLCLSAAFSQLIHQVVVD